MVSNVSGNGNTFGVLTQKLEERKKALESLNAQKDAVMQAISENKDNVQYREGITEDDKNKLAEYVVLHQNLKAPDVVKEPDKEPVQGDYKTTGEGGASVDDTNAYNTAHKKWEDDKAKYDQYQKDLQEYNDKKAALEEKINEYKAKDSENQNFLANLNEIAAKKEQELIATNQGIDVNTGDVERLNQEIAKMGQEGISFDVEKGDSKGYTSAVKRQFEELQKAGIIPADADQTKFTPEELAKLSKNLVDIDRANGTIGDNENGMSKYYRTMQADKSYGSYSLDQINELLESSGAGTIDFDKTFGSVSMDDLDKLGENYGEGQPMTAEPPVEAPVLDQPPVYVENSDETLSIAQPPVEAPVLNQPPVYADSSEEDSMSAEAPVEAPVTNQPPVYADDLDTPPVTTPPEVPADGSDGSVVGTPRTPETPQSGKLSEEQIKQKIKDLKPGESFPYVHTVESKGEGYSSSYTQKITWKRNDDGTLTCSYYEGVSQPTRVIDNYNENGQKVSTVKTNSKNPYQNMTINYGANGAISDRTIDLSSLPTSSNTSSMSKEYDLMRYLKNNQRSYSSQTITNQKGETMLTYKEGKFYKPDGKEISSDKALSMIEKAIDKGKISTVRQLR